MKEIIIYIPQEKLFEVTEILHKHNAVGMTFSEVMGSGRTKHDPVPEQVRAYWYGKTIIPEFVKRSKVETIVADSDAKAIVDDVKSSITKGKGEHGYIFVKEVLDAFVIGSDAHGEEVVKQ